MKPDGGKLYIRGTNLGNWLNPEGYMFGFGDTNCQRTINDLFCQMVGEEETARFWQEFKDNYITRADIEFIASTGANTIRLPFHYKLFTGRDYMGANNPDEGFARMDSTIAWCRDNGLYLILDMHVAPGGQTGDNIDDSYGYPYIFDSEAHQPTSGSALPSATRTSPSSSATSSSTSPLPTISAIRTCSMPRWKACTSAA